MQLVSLSQTMFIWQLTPPLVVVLWSWHLQYTRVSIAVTSLGFLEGQTTAVVHDYFSPGVATAAEAELSPIASPASL